MPEVIRQLCDPCFALGDTADASVGRVVTVDGGKPRRLLLCEGCDRKTWAPLAELLALAAVVVEPAAAVAKRGRPPGPPPADGLRCPAGCDAGPYRDRRSASTHARKSHHEWWLSADGRAWRGVGELIPCPDPACPESCASVPGLSRHVAGAHGMTLDEARAEYPA